jgi:hypothetical protein
MFSAQLREQNNSRKLNKIELNFTDLPNQKYLEHGTDANFHPI